ncbi:MAG: tetratricopeptide repeat protein, partial [Bacteroidota bacterium]
MRLLIVFWVTFCTAMVARGQVEADTSYLDRLNTLQSEANIQYRKGAFDASIHLSSQASAIAASHQNWESYIEAQSRISYIHYNQGKYAQCVVEFQHILHEMDSLGVLANRWIISSMAKLAKSYDRLGEFDAAIEWHEKRIRETKYPSDGSKIDSLDLARAYNNIGSTFQSFRRYEMAGIYYDSTLNFLIQSNGLGGTFDAYINGNKAMVSKALGFYKEAERYYQRTLELIPAFENYAYGKGYIYLAYSKFLADRNKSAIDNQRALNYCDSAFYFLQNSAGKVDCYGTYAKICKQQRRYDQSVHYLEKAIDELEKTTVPSHTRLLAYKNSLTSVYIKSGQFSLAKKTITEIRQNIESEQTRLLSFKSDVAMSEGNLLMAEKKPLDALQKYQEALTIILPKFKPATILENPDRSHLIVGLKAYNVLSQKITALKEAHMQTKKLMYMQSALECYDLMTSQLQLNAHELAELEQKLNYRGARQTIFIEAVETALTAYEVSQEQT